MGGISEGFKYLATDVLSWSVMAVGETAETMASYQVGQAVLKHIDRAFWLVEKSSQWALPPPTTHKGEKSLVVSELSRPLPWILFLPTLFILRLLREAISFAALLVGKEPIRPFTIVRWIQNCRRTLRGIKYQGLKNIRAKANRNQAVKCRTNYSISSWIGWITEWLQGLMCYNVVVYSQCQEAKGYVRKNSGEEIVVKYDDIKNKSDSSKMESSHNRSASPDDFDDSMNNDDDIKVLKDLINKLGEDLESDSDDTEFSISKLSQVASDTSATSSEEDEEKEDDFERFRKSECHCRSGEERPLPGSTSVQLHVIGDPKSPRHLKATEKYGKESNNQSKHRSTGKETKKFITRERGESSDSDDSKDKRVKENEGPKEGGKHERKENTRFISKEKEGSSDSNDVKNKKDNSEEKEIKIDIVKDKNDSEVLKDIVAKINDNQKEDDNTKINENKNVTAKEKENTLESDNSKDKGGTGNNIINQEGNIDVNEMEKIISNDKEEASYLDIVKDKSGTGNNVRKEDDKNERKESNKLNSKEVNISYLDDSKIKTGGGNNLEGEDGDKKENKKFISIEKGDGSDSDDLKDKKGHKTRKEIKKLISKEKGDDSDSDDSKHEKEYKTRKENKKFISIEKGDNSDSSESKDNLEIGESVRNEDVNKEKQNIVINKNEEQLISKEEILENITSSIGNTSNNESSAIKNNNSDDLIVNRNDGNAGKLDSTNENVDTSTNINESISSSVEESIEAGKSPDLKLLQTDVKVIEEQISRGSADTASNKREEEILFQKETPENIDSLNLGELSSSKNDGEGNNVIVEEVESPRAASPSKKREEEYSDKKDTLKRRFSSHDLNELISIQEIRIENSQSSKDEESSKSEKGESPKSLIEEKQSHEVSQKSEQDENNLRKEEIERSTGNSPNYGREKEATRQNINIGKNNSPEAIDLTLSRNDSQDNNVALKGNGDVKVNIPSKEKYVKEHSPEKSSSDKSSENKENEGIQSVSPISPPKLNVDPSNVADKPEKSDQFKASDSNEKTGGIKGKDDISIVSPISPPKQNVDLPIATDKGETSDKIKSSDLNNKPGDDKEKDVIRNVALIGPPKNNENAPIVIAKKEASDEKKQMDSNKDTKPSTNQKGKEAVKTPNINPKNVPDVHESDKVYDFHNRTIIDHIHARIEDIKIKHAEIKTIVHSDIAELREDMARHVERDAMSGPSKENVSAKNQKGGSKDLIEGESRESEINRTPAQKERSPSPKGSSRRGRSPSPKGPKKDRSESPQGPKRNRSQSPKESKKGRSPSPKRSETPSNTVTESVIKSNSEGNVPTVVATPADGSRNKDANAKNRPKNSKW